MFGISEYLSSLYAIKNERKLHRCNRKEKA
nr:MAG TPA: hypothetical protein [Bacteriophage sp.]